MGALGRIRSLPRALWAVVAAAVGLRLLLLPLIHPWDGNTFHSLFAQLAAGENPYVTFWELTLQARSRWGEGFANWYEYYAYPPLLLYVYWPLAQLAAALGPLEPHFYLAGTERTVPNVFPLAFVVLYKLPIWAADFAVAWMLWARTRKTWAVALWLLNPLVLLVSGTWMFDSIPVALALGAYLAFEKDRVALAGALLALGFLAKFYPLFLLPTFFLVLVRRRDPRAFLLVGAFAAVSVALCAPWWPEIGHAFAFNAGREGGGLTLHQLVQTWIVLRGESLLRFQTLQSPAIGALVLVGGMAATYLVLHQRRPPLDRALLLTMLAFLLFTKVVNEQYVLWVLPFLILVLARMADEAPVPRGAWAAAHLLWAVPFAYSFVHVPVTALVPGGSPWTDALLANRLLLVLAAAVAAAAFVAVLACSLWLHRPRAEEAQPA